MTDTNTYRDAIVAASDARRDAYVTQVTQAVEILLAQYGIHLDTDRYNDLDDYFRSLITSVEENGQ